MKPKLLLNDTKPGEDEGKVSWYPEPHFNKSNETGKIETKGTFRSLIVFGVVMQGPSLMIYVPPARKYPT